MNWRIPLARPVVSEKAKELVSGVLDSGFLSYGPLSQQFEAEFSAFHGGAFGVLSNSGTSSLQVALMAMKEKYGWCDGAKVICPATTFVASANIILMCGLKPVFVDIEPRTYAIDPAKLEAAVSADTVAVLLVHLFGIPADPDVAEIAKRLGLRIIEDCCETVGMALVGEVANYSFYACHPVCTGVGGMSVTNDPKLAELIRSYVNHGRKPGWINGLVSEGNLEDRFVFERMGYSYRITELEAALGVAQMEGLRGNLVKRWLNASCINVALAHPYNGDKLNLPELLRSYPMVFPVVLTENVKRNKFDVMRDLEAAGIETREMVPLLSQPFYRELGYRLEDYPVSKRVKDRGFYFGIYPEMTQEDLDYICDILGKAIKHEPILAR